MGGINALEARRRILLNTPHIETASGSIATFQTDMVGKLKGCKIYFEPVQEGSGDPSPDNVRPITGWTGCDINVNGTTIPLDWTDEAGTVYGGYVDLVKGEVVAECKKVTLDGTQVLIRSAPSYDGTVGTDRWLGYPDCIGLFNVKQQYENADTFSRKNTAVWAKPNRYIWCWTMNGVQLHFVVDNETVGITSDMEVAERNTHINNWLAENRPSFVMRLATPIHYPIDPVTLKTLRGTNNIFANTNGNTEVKFYTH